MKNLYKHAVLIFLLKLRFKWEKSTFWKAFFLAKQHLTSTHASLCVTDFVIGKNFFFNRPYLIPTTFAHAKGLMGKNNVSGLSGGKQMTGCQCKKSQSSFFYAIKRRRRFNSLAKTTFQVLTRFLSLLFAVSSPTFDIVYGLEKKKAMIERKQTHF